MKSGFYMKLITSAAAVLISVSFADISLMAESVFLKDGSIVTGNVVTDSAGSITVSLEDKKLMKISRSDIMRIIYTKLKTGKMFIQKRDGTSFIAYIVDEDQDSLTFRRELYKAEELTLKRSDILFMTEKNPSGLQVDGAVGTDSVPLKWLPPYGSVKKYNIYVRKNENENYELIGSTQDKSITIEGLLVKTVYYIIVKAVDSEDNESSASNEIRIMTMARVDVQLKDGKKFQTYIVDEDKDKYTFRDDPEKSAEYTVKKSAIVSVDDSGSGHSSDGISLAGISSVNCVSGFYPAVIIPMGKFGRMAGTGCGGIFSIALRDIFVRGADAGVSAGFYYAPGENLLNKGKPEYSTFLIAPLMADAGYRIKIGDNFSVAPRLSFGAVYIYSEYMTRDIATLEETGKTKNIFDPAVRCGAEMEYAVTERFSISVSGHYGVCIEKSGTMPFAEAGFGFRYIF